MVQYSRGAEFVSRLGKVLIFQAVQYANILHVSHTENITYVPNSAVHEVSGPRTTCTESAAALRAPHHRPVSSSVQLSG